jgi:hypothetical protein
MMLGQTLSAKSSDACFLRQEDRWSRSEKIVYRGPNNRDLVAVVKKIYRDGGGDDDGDSGDGGTQIVEMRMLVRRFLYG